MAAPPAWSDPPRVVAIALVNGKAVVSSSATGRAPVLRLRQGEAVELRWSSDREVVVHLHGYGIEARGAPGTDGVMIFTARAAGRFPVETHDEAGRHRAVAYVEVHPR